MKQDKTNISQNIWWQWGGMNLVAKGACLAAAIPLLYLMIASAFGGGGALVVVGIGGSFVLLFLWSVAMGWVQGRFWQRCLPEMQGWQGATRWALAAAEDGTVRLWQWPCLQEKLVLPVSNSYGEAAPAVVTGGGRYLVTKNLRSEQIIVDIATGETVRELAQGVGQKTAVSPNGQYIVGNHKSIIYVYNFADGHEVCQFTAHDEGEGPSRVTNILFTPDSQQVLSTSYYSSILVWDPATCTETFALESTVFPIDQIAVHPSGQYVAAITTQHGRLYMWDLATQQRVFEHWQVSDDFWMGNILFSPDGRYLIAGGDFGTLRIWDWQANTEIYHNTIPDLTRVAITPDGQQLITMTKDGSVDTLNWNEITE